MKTKINYLLVLVLAGFVVTGCCSMKHCNRSKTQQWEYKTEKLYFAVDLNPDAINKAATDGWQLVSVTAIPNDLNQSAVAIFKRPKQ